MPTYPVAVENCQGVKDKKVRERCTKNSNSPKKATDLSFGNIVVHIPGVCLKAGTAVSCRVCPDPAPFWPIGRSGGESFSGRRACVLRRADS